MSDEDVNKTAEEKEEEAKKPVSRFGAIPSNSAFSSTPPTPQAPADGTAKEGLAFDEAKTSEGEGAFSSTPPAPSTPDKDKLQIDNESGLAFNADENKVDAAVFSSMPPKEGMDVKPVSATSTTPVEPPLEPAKEPSAAVIPKEAEKPVEPFATSEPATSPTPAVTPETLAAPTPTVPTQEAAAPTTPPSPTVTPVTPAPAAQETLSETETAPKPAPAEPVDIKDVPVAKETTVPGQAPVRIGDKLLNLGLINQDQLNVALHEQKAKGAMLGETLVELGFVSTEMLTHFLSESTGYETFDPKTSIVDPDALDVVEKRDAIKHRVIPIALNTNEEGVTSITLAMADPDDIMALDSIKKIIPRGYNIVRQICAPAVIIDAIHRVYESSSSIQAILKELSGDKDAAKQNLDELSEDESYSHPIVRLINALLFEGMKKGVSDLHFEPEENFARVRYRLDGDLIVAHTFHKEYWSGICQRLKIMSQMNIADKLSAQDGRFKINMGGREADFRVSTMPTVHGENVVLRILDKSASIVPLDDLGFSDRNLKLIERSIAKPEGIIIVTGPTGSGKTTTLYSILSSINKIDVNIMTLEDPVEYQLPNIRQSNLRAGSGLSFSEGVKALLRQDPDIIFVGEVRDSPTADQALKAAMTGHQVYTTLHTNDSFGSIPRLLDFELKAGMLAGSVISIFAQRLIRRICPNCKESYTASPEECKLLGRSVEEKITLFRGKGCKECGDTGNKGRCGIHEILFMDDEINDLIASEGDLADIRKVALEHGFVSMRDDGVEKVYQGLISLEELRKKANFADRI